MMWSENRDFNIPPQELKAGYKAVTTELRERGIRGAIESGHQELMGKALVKMLTKFDREPCQGYAFEPLLEDCLANGRSPPEFDRCFHAVLN